MQGKAVQEPGQQSRSWLSLHSGYLTLSGAGLGPNPLSWQRLFGIQRLDLQRKTKQPTLGSSLCRRERGSCSFFNYRVGTNKKQSSWDLFIGEDREQGARPCWSEGWESQSLGAQQEWGKQQQYQHQMVGRIDLSRSDRLCGEGTDCLWGVLIGGTNEFGKVDLLWRQRGKNELLEKCNWVEWLGAKFSYLGQMCSLKKKPIIPNIYLLLAGSFQALL